jgi:hypothetical protein
MRCADRMDGSAQRWDITGTIRACRTG